MYSSDVFLSPSLSLHSSLKSIKTYPWVRIKNIYIVYGYRGRVQRNFRWSWDSRHGSGAQLYWGWEQGGDKKVMLQSLIWP